MYLRRVSTPRTAHSETIRVNYEVSIRDISQTCFCGIFREIFPQIFFPFVQIYEILLFPKIQILRNFRIQIFRYNPREQRTNYQTVPGGGEGGPLGEEQSMN